MNRYFFASFTAILALLCCGGCQPSTDLVRITLWHQMTPGERALMEKELRRFEAAHPGVVVSALYKETEELRSGFEAAALAGIGPELVFGPSDVIQLYQTMGIVRDMRPWFDDATLAAFVPTALTILPARDGTDAKVLLQIGDRIGNHLALVYNRDFIKKPPQDTDELIQTSRRKHANR